MTYARMTLLGLLLGCASAASEAPGAASQEEVHQRADNDAVPAAPEALVDDTAAQTAAQPS